MYHFEEPILTLGILLTDDWQITWPHLSKTGGLSGVACSRETGHEKMEWKAK